MLKTKFWCVVAITVCITGNSVSAQDQPPEKEKLNLSLGDDFPGTEDFDEATRIKVTAEGKAALTEVIKLCQSALKKGLDEIDAASAKKMIGAAAIQKARMSFEEAGARANPGRLQRIAAEALTDLQIAIEADPDNTEAYVLKARLHMLRQENKKAAEVLDKGIESLKKSLSANPNDSESKSKLSDMYLMKSVMQQDVDDRLRELKLAIELDPENEKAVQQTVETLAALSKTDEAVEILKQTLKLAPDNEYAIKRLATLYLQEDKIDEAVQFLTEKINAFPDKAGLYAIRADIYLKTEREAEALADTEKALEMQPKDLGAKIVRAKANLLLKNYDKVKADIEEIEQSSVDNPEVAAAVQNELFMLQRNLAVMEKRYADVIAIYERLVQANPDNVGLLLELGSFYQMDNKPKKALRVAERLIKSDQTNWQAYRLRGDVYLSMGRHSDAISDYESALDNIPDDDEDYSGVLNNLSWVLSTSTQDSVRNGQRALELGLKACEITKYAKPHILSTLAAAYGELGQFDKAIEWSQKAVELGEKESNEQVEQLKEELKSYRENKPWREIQKPSDKPSKAAPAGSNLDT